MALTKKPCAIALWVIDTVQTPEGGTIQYGYTDGFLSSVNHTDSSQSTFQYSWDQISNCLKQVFHDVIADPGHRNKNVYFTGSVSQYPEYPGELIYSSAGVTRLVTNGQNEVAYAAFSPNLAYMWSGDHTIYEGGGVVKYSEQSYTRYETSYLKPGWTRTTQGPQGEKEPAITVPPGGQLLVKDGVATQHTMVNGKVVLIDHADDTFEAFCYNNKGLVIRERDRKGNVTRYVYDAKQRLIEQHVGLVDGPAGQTGNAYSGTTYDTCRTDEIQTAEYAVLKWEYNVAGKLSAKIDENGVRTEFQYNSLGHLVKVIAPPETVGGANPETQYVYNSLGQQTRVTNPLGQHTDFFYDNMGRVFKTLFDDGTSKTVQYGVQGNGAGLPVKEIGRNGLVTTFEYDAADRLIRKVTGVAVVDGSNTEVPTPPGTALEEKYVYLPGTSKPMRYDRAGQTSIYEYDYRGRQVRTLQFPDSDTELETVRRYAKNNRLSFTEDPYGRKTYYAYDATDGRLIRTIQGLIPEFEIAQSDPNNPNYDPFSVVLNYLRDDSPNASYVITDRIYDAKGNVIESYDARQIKSEFEYDSRSRRIADISAVGTPQQASSETDYDLASRVTEVRSPRFFDASDTLGHQTAKEAWAYTPSGKVASHTDAPGSALAATESFTYDLIGRQLTHTDFAGNVSKMHHEECCGLVNASENPLGHGSIVRTDSMGHTIHQASVKDYADHAASLDNPVDAKTLREVTSKYDGRGRVVATTTWLTPRGLVDASDPPIAGLGNVPAADGLTTQYLYDDNLADGTGLDSAAGAQAVVPGTPAISLAAAITKLAQAPSSGGANVVFDADASGRAQVVINPEGEVSFSISDAAGRNVISGQLDPDDGSLITWNCSVHDQTETINNKTYLVSTSVNALGKTQKQISDGAGRALRSVDALGKITTSTFNASGNRLSVRDPNGVGQDCTYDALGRDTGCVDTAGAVTSSGYDKAGNKVSSTDAKGETTTFVFDARGRQTKQIDRLGGETVFAYSANGSLQSLTDAEGQVTSYTYDAAGNKLTETYPDHVAGSTIGTPGYGVVTFAPDATGRTALRTDQQGDTCSFAYDLAGRLLTKAYVGHASGPLAGVTDTDTFTYDGASRMLTAISGRYANTVAYTYDAAGRKATESMTMGGQTYSIGTDYDLTGQVSRLTYPDGTEVDRTYSECGQLATIAFNGTTIDTRTYDDGGRMLTSSYNNGVSESRTYNIDNTLASINFAGAPIGNLTYGWDANKNKTSEGISSTMSGYGFNVGGSGYDEEDRLVNWQRSDNNLNQAWNLSLVGDWNSITENASTQSRTHGPTHELLTAAGQAVQHDVKGNMTHIPANLRPTTSGTPQPLSLTWDFDNRLVSADTNNDSTADVFYKWDALGRRVGRIEGTSATVYVQDGQQTIADYTLGTAPTSSKYNYLYASYIDEPVMRTGSGNSIYLHRNQQHSIIALTNGGGTVTEHYAYTAYGTPTILSANLSPRATSAEGNRYTYTGREYDETLDLYYYRARIYDSVAGRFCSRDPIGFDSSPNLFAYVDGSVLGFIDPIGTSKCSAEACTNGPTSIGEGQYYVRAEVVGSRCHGGFGGCCTLADGDAYIVISYSEHHTVGQKPAYGELNRVSGRRRFGDIEKRGCTLSQSAPIKQPDGSWALTATATCPIKCGDSCNCADGEASLGVYSPLHRWVHPDQDIERNKPIDGLEAFSMQFTATASLSDKSTPCMFGGCDMTLNASWDSVKFQDPGPKFPGWNPDCTKPNPNDYPNIPDYYRAYETYLRCLGTYIRQRRPWDGTNCSGKDFSRARELF